MVLPKFKHKLSGITLVPSDGGRFELSANGTLIYSKLETGKFPDNDAIIKKLEDLLR